MSEALATIERGLEAVNRLEARVNVSVRCCDCAFKDKITVKNISGYCPKADRKLTGSAHKTLSQPRNCLTYQPNGKEKTQ